MADAPIDEVPDEEPILEEPPEEEGDDQVAGGGAPVEPINEDDLKDAPEDPDADS